MKPCSVCDEVKPMATRSSRCRDCHNIYTRAHYQANKQYYIDKARRKKLDVRAKIQEAKEKPCTDCNGVFPYYVMDFDHRSDKEFNISEMHGQYGWTRIKAEIDKCDVVCSNCHRIRSFNRMPL